MELLNVKLNHSYNESQIKWYDEVQLKSYQRKFMGFSKEAVKN